MFVDPTPDITVDSVDACLPQTQCMRCEFASCLAYAQAIVGQNVAINRCPPGGSRTLALLAALTGQTCSQLDPDFGVYHPAKPVEIDETLCIGCTLCIKACPVDAIVGSARAMHTVVTAECSGCDLCIPVCPVDCIKTASSKGNAHAADKGICESKSKQYRTRFAGRQKRQSAGINTPQPQPLLTEQATRRLEIAASVARIQVKRVRRSKR
jgi:electron transport complex protein RnfB